MDFGEGLAVLFAICLAATPIFGAGYMWGRQAGWEQASGGVVQCVLKENQDKTTYWHCTRVVKP